MPIVDPKKDGAAYAKYFSNHTISGTRFLSFRDIPWLIKRYVSGSKTLDYGSGAGRSSKFLKSLGLNVEGADINPEMIKQAEASDPTGKYRLIKSAEIPVEDNYYDLVFSSYVLLEIGSKPELLKILQEITRVLKPGGTFIGVVGNADAYKTDWLTVKTNFEENKDLQSGSIVKVHLKDVDLTIVHYFWSEEDYSAAIREAGLSIVLTHNPLGTDEDGYDWVNEKVKSPCTIFVAKKPAEGNGN